MDITYGSANQQISIKWINKTIIFSAKYFGGESDKSNVKCVKSSVNVNKIWNNIGRLIRSKWLVYKGRPRIP